MSNTYPKLTDELLREIKDLEKKCVKADGYRARNYWHILKDPDRWQPADFFHRDEKGELLGYLGYYIFHPGVMDVIAMVAPKARRRGIFKALWQELLWLTKRFQIHKFRFPCDPNATAMKAWLERAVEYLHTEYHMLKKNTAHLPEKIKELSLERVDASFVNMISEFDVACFNADFARTVQRYTDNFKMAHRQAWMVKLKDQYIGKIHLRFDATCVFLHDICILPEFQHRGYGADALRSIKAMISVISNIDSLL